MNRLRAGTSAVKQEEEATRTRREMQVGRKGEDPRTPSRCPGAVRSPSIPRGGRSQEPLASGEEQGLLSSVESSRGGRGAARVPGPRGPASGLVLPEGQATSCHSQQGSLLPQPDQELETVTEMPLSR